VFVSEKWMFEGTNVDRRKTRQKKGTTWIVRGTKIRVVMMLLNVNTGHLELVLNGNQAYNTRSLRRNVVKTFRLETAISGYER
jgi:hypothetical protein